MEELVETEECATTSVNLAETIDVCCRRHRIDPDVLEQALALLLEPIRVLAPGVSDARRAAAIRRNHYRRRVAELSLADCFLLAAPLPGDSIATDDRVVLRTAATLGFGTISLS